ncbi:MAG: glycosyltransferase [Bacteroides sp.]|jgi:glycosyltransferase involved in cell wall biosynthesis|nr:glycosyltransferase [Bacteroides sp.]
MRRVIFTVTNDVFTDQRVNKMAQTLQAMGFQPLIAGVMRKGSPPFCPEWAEVKRIPVWFQKGLLFYAEFNLKLFFFLLFSKADLFVANDLDTLLPVHLVARLRRKPLVYDTHEYFTGSPEIEDRPFRCWFWKSLEKYLFPRQNTIITVNESIAALYKKDFGKKLHVVRNMPRYRKPVEMLSRTELGLPESQPIILLQGSGINVNRGTEELIEAFLPEYGIGNALLLIIGDGNVMEQLKEKVKDLRLEKRVRFLPKMPYEQLMQFTSNATIGVSLDKPGSLNYLYSLPNKLFDYIMAGTPVLVSDLPELSRIVKKYQVGKIAVDHDPATIAASISEMLSNSVQLELWKSNCLQAAKELNWEKEEVVIRGIYKKVLEDN